MASLARLVAVSLAALLVSSAWTPTAQGLGFEGFEHMLQAALGRNASTTAEVATDDASSEGARDLQIFTYEGPRPVAPIVIVGNGPSLLDRRRLNDSWTMGKVIDSYKDVARINLHQIRHYAEFIGSRTTVCFMGQLKRPKFGKPNCPKYIVPIVVADKKKKKSKDKKKKKYYKLTRGTYKSISTEVKKYYRGAGLIKRLELMSPRYQRDLRYKWKLHAGPSTGLQAIIYCVVRQKRPRRSDVRNERPQTNP